MWPDLGPEMDAFKRNCYGGRYRTFRDKLQNDGLFPKKRREFLEIENSFLYLISYMVGRFDKDGWGHGLVFQELLTSHMVRLLCDMGVSLKEHWNLADDPTAVGPQTIRGNLCRAAGRLISLYNDPSEPNARWGSDLWDDCYILLSLLKVSEELQEINPQQAGRFRARCAESLNWLRNQTADGFRTVGAASDWFGPGFHAAAIELFDYLQQKGEIQDGAKLIGTVVKEAVPLLEMAVKDNKILDWDRHFPWHVGQFIVAWKEKRKDADNPNGYEALSDIDTLMQRLYARLKERQCKDGSWAVDKDVVNTNYNTVRGLAACYVMERDTADGLVNSVEIERAHGYLLKETHQAEPLGHDDKACVNAIDAFQKLFEFKIPNIHLHLLVSLSYRLHCLGLEKTILSPPRENERELLKTVRLRAKEELEDQGQLAIEALGVNGRLYDYLIEKPKFLNEFNENDHEKTRNHLQSFLSSTMTEVRSASARTLIRELWSREGLLNFLPLIAHLSDLEHERAFFKFYRDHLNHEVLLFLLGVLIYYKNKKFRESINEEILKTYAYYQATPCANIEEEFLFRWKLIATFHDIGYLFEVDPPDEEYSTPHKKLKEKSRLLAKSFSVIDTVRREFLQEYFKQYSRDASAGGIESDVAVIEKGLKKYSPKISKAEHLFSLKTAKWASNAFDMMDRMFEIRGTEGHIAPGLLKNYFDLCRSNNSKGSFERDRFYDHGIMSALILLKVADVQRYYLEQLRERKFSPELRRYPKLVEQLKKESTGRDLSEEQFYIRFSHVAGAVALHNIYPGLYSESQCQAFDAKNGLKGGKALANAFYPSSTDANDRYAISLDENPMAYLTALADVLQDWDRHSFRRPSFKSDQKTPISSSEVVIDCVHDKIQITPLSELARKRYLDHVQGMRPYILDCDSYVGVSPLHRHYEGQQCPAVERSAV